MTRRRGVDRQEARELLNKHLGSYRAEGYTALLRLLHKPDSFEVEAASGTEYQIEISAVWDGKDGGDLRVMGAIGDGGLRTFIAPLCSDFIIRPDGTFAGE